MQCAVDLVDPLGIRLSWSARSTLEVGMYSGKERKRRMKEQKQKTRSANLDKIHTRKQPTLEARREVFKRNVEQRRKFFIFDCPDGSEHVCRSSKVVYLLIVCAYGPVTLAKAVTASANTAERKKRCIFAVQCPGRNTL